MNKLVTNFIILLIAGFFLLAFDKEATSQEDYNILVIGDDISMGNNSTRLSWRYYLWKNLIEDVSFDYTIDMVGTQSQNQGGNPTWPMVGGLSFDSDHEAYFNKLAYQMGVDLNSYLLNYSADIVLIHIGVVELNNYFSFPGTYPPRLYNRLKGIIRLVQGANPGATIFVAQHIPLNYADAEVDVNTFNALVANINDDLDTDVVVVDMNTGFQTDDSDPGDSWYAGTYPSPVFYIPNTTGEQEMGDRWHTAIMANLPDVKHRWTGGAESADWNTAANWNQGTVPGSTDDVVIPTGASTWPVISGNLSVGLDCRKFVMEKNTQCTVTGDVIIRDEQTLDIFPGADLNIGGDLKNSESILGGARVSATPNNGEDKDAYMNLAVSSPFQLLSVKVYPNNATLPGSRTFYWSAWDGAQYVVQEQATVDIPTDPEGDGERIDLNFDITVTSDPVNYPHRIGISGSVPNDTKLTMEFGGASFYPIAVGSVASLTGADPSYNPLADWRYWYMYDWEYLPLDPSAYTSHTLFGENSTLDFNGTSDNSMVGTPVTDGSGKMDKTEGLGGYSNDGAINIFPMRFNAMFPFRLVSAYVYAQTTGPKSIVWQSSDGTLGDTVVVNITSTEGQRIYLNFLIPPGEGHKLGVLTTGPALYRDYDGAGLAANGTGFEFPFPLGNVGNITATNIFMFYYHYFYDIEVAPVYYDVNLMKPGYAMTTDGTIGIGNNLTVEPGSFLTVDTDDEVFVGGDFELQADGSGIASYLNNGTMNVKGTTRMQQYLTPDVWHYVSSPMANALSGVYTGVYLNSFDEPSQSWDPIVPIDVPLEVMQGYAAWNYSTPFTANFEGTLNAGEITNVVTNQSVSADFGWNLLGNPYPSALDWDAASGWTKTDIYDSYYIWSGVGGGGGGTYNYYGSVIPITIPPEYNLAAGIIPPGQGFIVKAINDGNLTVDNNARVHNSQAFYKSGNETELQQIRLQVKDQNNLLDETVVRFFEDATIEFDQDYDGFKLKNSSNPQIYSRTAANEHLILNTLPEVQNGTTVPVSTTVPEDGVYFIHMTEFVNFDEEISVFLKDAMTGEVYSLSENPVYEFVASVDDDPNRFTLIFADDYTALEETGLSEVNIYSYEKDVMITLPEIMEGADVNVFDLMGKEVYSGKISGTSRAVIHIPGSAGHYVVKVRTDERLYTEKVLLR